MKVSKSPNALHKLSMRIRDCLARLKRTFSHMPSGAMMVRFMVNLRENGVKTTLRKVKRHLEKRLASQKKKRSTSLSRAQKTMQVGTHFPQSITFSLLVPLYNTPRKPLLDMLLSVQSQTYGDWELCLADGSDEKHAYVKDLCQGWAQKDKRIKYNKLSENGGISINTNRCIDMSTGA